MPEFKQIDVTERSYLYSDGSCGMDPAEISAEMGRVFQAVYGFMAARGIQPAGPALSVYYGYDPEKMNFRGGFFVAAADAAKAEGEVKADVTPAGRVLQFIHKGSYATLRDDYGTMMQHVEEKGLTLGAPTWEVYLNDPSNTPEEELLTEIYCKLG